MMLGYQPTYGLQILRGVSSIIQYHHIAKTGFLNITHYPILYHWESRLAVHDWIAPVDLPASTRRGTDVVFMLVGLERTFYPRLESITDRKY